MKKHGNAVRGTKSPEYVAWDHMKRRCNNPQHPAYKDYGGRGIRVCERWMKSFASFLADVGKRPSSKHSLDRFPNKNGNYELGNVRWATEKEQNRNRRDNRLLTFGGETFSVSEWAEKLGVGKEMLFARLRRGWTVEKTLTIINSCTSGNTRST